MRIPKATTLTLLLMMSTVAAYAQTAPTAQPTLTGVRADVANFIEYEKGRFVALAEAIPAEKYAWRPAEGVRSVSEVLMHVAGANYFFPTFYGGAIPEGIDPRSFEKTITEKEQVLQQLHASFAFLSTAAAAVPEADLEKPVELFGNPSTQRGVLLLTGNHLAEHMGQLIAYARMNGIAPPWSE